MYTFLRDLDRRWTFLLMLLAVAIPILLQKQFPETPSALSKAVFDQIEKLKPGDKVLISFDFDPASEGELGPMATDIVHQCCEKKLKIYFIALWPVGPSLIEDNIRRVIKADYPDMVYGENYVNLGFKSGAEGVIKVILTDLRSLYTTDSKGTPLDQIPMCRDLRNIQGMNLLVSISAGSGGIKEWIQYAITPYRDRLKMVGGSTGVQAPQLFPYIPDQLPGLLAAIKGAAEYEKLVNEKYSGPNPDPKYREAIRRMGPQLVAHLLMIGLIITGNVIYFMQRRAERQSR
jgi:hypothetical protein